MTTRTPADLEADLRRLLASGQLDLPLPGAGSTPARLERLVALAAADLELARLAEAHTDAVAILAEAGHPAAAGCLYGVWAAGAPGSSGLHLDRGPGGTTVSGRKTFCSGAGIVDRALVTVIVDGASCLLDLDVRSDRIRFDDTGWVNPAFGATNTADAIIDQLAVEPQAIVGPPNWYLDRVGFWHGACGPAACWAGGAAGLAERAIAIAASWPPDPHRHAHLGELDTLRWQLSAVVDKAGGEIDDHPHDQSTARVRALRLRHSVERTASAILDVAARTLGPRPLTEDGWIIRRMSEVQLYIRQHHAERDLAVVGEQVARH